MTKAARLLTGRNSPQHDWPEKCRPRSYFKSLLLLGNRAPGVVPLSWDCAPWWKTAANALPEFWKPIDFVHSVGEKKKQRWFVAPGYFPEDYSLGWSDISWFRFLIPVRCFEPGWRPYNDRQENRYRLPNLMPRTYPGE
jgi:hypothetical protein